LSQKSVEDYLKAVYDLSRNGTAVSTTEISRTLKVAPASVTEMLKKLAENGYVNYSPYHGSSLTEKGFQGAQKVARKHRLLEKFLSDVLHIRNDQVHSQACEMEHALSDEAEESLCRFLKHPDTCPDDGIIIPACNLPFTSCEECVQLHKRTRGLGNANITRFNMQPEGRRGGRSLCGATECSETAGHGVDPGQQ
jgi:DtxR family Mn-dependent transcriptional regulator